LILASVGLLFLNGVLHNVFVAADRLRQETVVQVSAATVNIGLNLVLIPSYGLMGAASATLAAEAFSLCCGFFILWRRGLLAGVRSILRPLIAAGIMGAAVYLVGHDQSLLVTIPVGVVTYSLALILLRGVPEDAGIALGRRTESDPS
jgi:O-antigen/teichoic acid export membrane protein